MRLGTLWRSTLTERVINMSKKKQKPIGWYTRGGKHIPIYENYTVTNNEKIKQLNISKSEEEIKIKNKTEDIKLKDNVDFDSFVKDNFEILKVNYKNKSMDDIKQEWYNTRHNEEIKNLHEISYDKFDKSIHIKSNILDGWYRNADSSYKPKIAESIFNNHETLNAGMNIAYYNYRYQFERYSSVYGKWIPHEGVDQSKKLSFKQWLNTPQTMYRGTKGQKTVDSDVFISYSPDKSVAMKFAGTSGSVDTIQIKPIDTWGSYKTTGEQEYLVPAGWLIKHKK